MYACVLHGIVTVLIGWFVFLPEGAACVVFATSQSFIAAVSSRFMHLSRGSLEKKVRMPVYC